MAQFADAIYDSYFKTTDGLELQGSSKKEGIIDIITMESDHAL